MLGKTPALSIHSRGPGSDRTLVAVLLGMLLTGLAGCGRRGPDLVAVQGTVLLDGQPLPRKSVGFAPSGGTPGHGGIGWTREDGSFEIFAIVPGAIKPLKGLPPGSYKVVVSDPDSSFLPGPGQPAAQGSGAPVPDAYRYSDSSPLRAEIDEDSKKIAFELSSKLKSAR